MNEVDTELENVADITAVLNEEDGAEPKVYEVGYHILPTVAETDVEGEVSKITDLLKKLNAEFIGERFPSLVNLAYTIEKKIDGTLRRFDTAYFGWVAFTLSPAALQELKEKLDENENILRFIIVKTSKAQVEATMADPGLDVGAPQEEEEVSEEVDSEEEEEESV